MYIINGGPGILLVWILWILSLTCACVVFEPCTLCSENIKNFKRQREKKKYISTESDVQLRSNTTWKSCKALPLYRYARVSRECSPSCFACGIAHNIIIINDNNNNNIIYVLFGVCFCPLVSSKNIHRSNHHNGERASLVLNTYFKYYTHMCVCVCVCVCTFCVDIE